jgi:5-formyltetrahydrofolate cyclo-ligase
MDKAQLRSELQNCLLAMPQEQRDEKSRKACQNLISLAQFQDASTIMMYLTLPNEADTSEAILNAWQHGKVVVVPKVLREHRHMIPVQIHSLERGIQTYDWGLRNPTAGIPIPFGEIDMVVTPALGFDKKGNRLGRGGAYYDRFFANSDLRASRCGFAFSEQFINSIPVTEHDKPMDILVTDEEITYFNNRKGE